MNKNIFLLLSLILLLNLISASSLVFNKDVFICFDEHGSENIDCSGSYNIYWKDSYEKIIFESYFVDDDGEVNLVNSEGETYNVFKEEDGINQPVHDLKNRVYINKDLTPYMTKGNNRLEGYAKDLGGSLSYIGGRIKIYAKTPANEPPTIKPLPDISIGENSGYSSKLINLWDYASDDRDNASELIYTISNETNPGLIDCLIKDNQYFECNPPAPNKTGLSVITIEVRDRDNAKASANFNVYVYEKPNSAPSIGNLPDTGIEENSPGKRGLIDLWAYAEDAESSDDELSYSIASESNPSLIMCIVGDNRYISCYAPTPNETGSSTITVEVEDPEGASSSDSFTVTVYESSYNTLPRISGIPNPEVEENSGSSYYLIDLRDYADDDEDSDDELQFRIVSQSNRDLIYCYVDDDYYVSCDAPTQNEIGSNIISVEVKDSEGATDYDEFIVYVVEGYPYYPDCADLEIETHTVYVDEDRTGYETFRLSNDSGERFYIDDVDVYDYSSYFSVSAYSNDGYADAGGSANLQIEVMAYSVDGDKSGTGYVEITGHFESGQTCIGIEQFTVNVSDTAYTSPPRISGIPNPEVEENSGSSYYLIDLRDYADDDEDSDDELQFRIVSQSNRDLIYCYVDDDYYISCDAPEDYETGHSKIIVEVEDTDGATDDDEFVVYVVEEYSTYAECDDLEIVTHTVYVDEDSTEYETFRLRNDAEERFYIEDVDAHDLSSYFSVSEYTNDSYANADGEADIKIKVMANSVSKDRTGTAYIEVSGYFSNGRSCSFSNIGEESFTVKVEDEGGKSSCGEIDLRLSDVTVPQDSTKYKTFSIKNNADEKFYIDGVDVYDDSAYFNAEDYSHDRSIGANSSGDLKIKIKSYSVSSNKRGKVTVKLNGHFSSGKSCSYSDITESFYLTVEEEEEEPEPEEEIAVSFSTGSILLEQGKSKTITATFKNNSQEWKCISLIATTSSPKISASLEDDYFCLNSGRERIIDLTVSAGSTVSGGSYSVGLKTNYDSTTEKKTLEVNIEAPLIPEEAELFISAYPSTINIKTNESKEVAITIENTGNVTVEDITVSLVGLPQGMYFEPIHQAILKEGRSVTLTGTLEIGEVEERIFTVVLEVEADGIREVEQIDINVTKPAPTEGIPAGLISLAGSVTIGLALLIVLLVIIIIIVSVVKRR